MLTWAALTLLAAAPAPAPAPADAQRPAAEPAERLQAASAQLEVIARQLDRFRSLQALTWIPANDPQAPRACSGLEAQSWIVSATLDGGEGVSCLSGPSRAARCLEWSGTAGRTSAEQTVCDDLAPKNAAVGPPPPWFTDPLAVLGAATFVTRVSSLDREAGRPTLAFHVTAGRGGTWCFLAVRDRDGWKTGVVPVATFESRWRLRRVQETGALLPGGHILVFDVFGGSQVSGEVRSELVLVGADGQRLAPVARRPIGLLAWRMSPEEFRDCPECANDLRSRTHVEVRLTPVVSKDGTLVLYEEVVTFPEDAERRFLKIADAARELLKDAGIWKLGKTGLVYLRER